MKISSHSKTLAYSRPKSRSTTISQLQDNKKTIKVNRPKEKSDRTISCKNRDQKLRGIMASTYDLLKASTRCIDPPRKQKNRDIIHMAEDIHSLVSSMMRRQNKQTSKKKSDYSMVCLDNDPHKSGDRDNLLHYFKAKFGSEIKDEESIQKRLKGLQMLKKSQQVSRYQSQSIQSTDYDRENYNSMNNRRIPSNHGVLNRKDL